MVNSRLLQCFNWKISMVFKNLSLKQYLKKTNPKTKQTKKLQAYEIE